MWGAQFLALGWVATFLKLFCCGACGPPCKRHKTQSSAMLFSFCFKKLNWELHPIKVPVDTKRMCHLHECCSA
eukprot:2909699-Amphidinium_carterae.1